MTISSQKYKKREDRKTEGPKDYKTTDGKTVGRAGLEDRLAYKPVSLLAYKQGGLLA